MGMVDHPRLFFWEGWRQMRRIAVVLLIVGLLLSMDARKPEGRTEAPPRMRIEPMTTVIRVGDVEVVAQEVRESIKALTPHGRRITVPPDRVIEAIVGEVLFYMDARDRGIRLDPLVQCREKALRDRWLGFRYSVQTADRYRPSREDVESLLPSTFEIAQVSEITLATRSEAEEVLKKLAGGADFEEQARTVSISPSAPAGGKVGIKFLSGKSQMWNKEVQDTFFTIPAEGLNPEPVRTDMGYTIFRIDSREEMSPAMVRDYRSDVMSKVASKKYAEYAGRMRERYPMTIREESLRSASRDPLGHLDMIVAKVGKNKISFGETVAEFDRGRSLPEAGEKALRAARGYLERYQTHYAMREAAVEEGFLDDPVVRMNFRKLHREILTRKYRERLTAKVSVSEMDIRRAYKQYRERNHGKIRYELGIGEFPSRELAILVVQRLNAGNSIADLLSPVGMGHRQTEGFPSSFYLQEDLPPYLRGLEDTLEVRKAKGPFEVVSGEGRSSFAVVQLLSLKDLGEISLGEIHDELKADLRESMFKASFNHIISKKRRTVNVRVERDLFDALYDE